MSAPIRSVALLGTGIMGAAIGRNLLEAGFGVRAWNRSRDKAEPLAPAGATLGDSPADAVAGADAILTMLSDADAVVEVAERALAAADDDAIWLQMSTVGVAATERLAAQAAKAGLAYVDCPVLGTRQPAEDGQLVVLASGPRVALAAAAPVFEAIGARTIELGDDPGAATRLKLVLNTWVLALTAGLAETLAVAHALGVDGGRFLDMIEGGPLDSGYAQMKGAMMLGREYEPSFPLRLAHKDARLVLEAVDDQDLDPILLDAVRRRFAEAEEIGHGDSDMAAVFEAASPREDARPAAAP
jgi:3-hydroxyisobutyrate dehydrogenase